jgi:DNA polymerase-4
MGNVHRAVCHLNIVGYRAAVATVKDRELSGRPFVITGATGGRSLVLDLSPEAMKEGISPGMALAAAERKVKDLTVLPPDPAVVTDKGVIQVHQIVHIKSLLFRHFLYIIRPY